MKCENAHDLFSVYSEETLSPAMKLALEQHLASYEACRAEYEAFQQVISILDEGLPEVDLPAGFHLAVMERIAAQAPAMAETKQAPAVPNPLRQLVGSWRSFAQNLISTPRRAFVTGVACTLLAIGVFTGLHSHSFGRTISATSPQIPASMLAVPVQHTSGILQNAVQETQNGQDYHVFGIHLPLGVPTAQIKAFVLQNGSGLTDDAALNNADNATPAWSGTAEQGVSIHVPVAVVSNVAAGTTLNFLVAWNPVSDPQSEEKEVAFVPIADRAAAPTPINAGDTLYDVLQNISSSYNTKIFVDPSAVDAATQAATEGASGLAALTGSEGSARAALQTALSPAGYNIVDEGD